MTLKAAAMFSALLICLFSDGDVILVQDTSLTWNQAREHCIALGGDLARPKDLNSVNFLHTFVLVELNFPIAFYNYYIGFTSQGYNQVPYVGRESGRVCWRISVYQVPYTVLYY